MAALWFTNTGLGVVIEGTRSRQAFRLARKEDLLKDRPWLPLSPAERQALAVNGADDGEPTR